MIDIYKHRPYQAEGEPFKVFSHKANQTDAGGGEFGGDGGESNSPSKGSYPEYTTSLVSSFILPG